MTSVYNVQRVKRNELGIVPSKRRRRSPKNPTIVINCMLCGKEKWTSQSFTRYCSIKCSNRFRYLKNREERIENQKKYYKENKEAIRKYQRSPRGVSLRRRRQKWENMTEEQIKKVKKRNKKYQLAHLDKYRKYNRRYYYKKRGDV